MVFFTQLSLGQMEISTEEGNSHHNIIRTPTELDLVIGPKALGGHSEDGNSIDNFRQPSDHLTIVDVLRYSNVSTECPCRNLSSERPS